MSSEPDHEDCYEWEEIHIEDGRGFVLPKYCVEAGYLDGRPMHIGKVIGHIQKEHGEEYVNTPAQILYGASPGEDKITFTYGDCVYDAFQEHVKAAVFGLVLPKSTLIEVEPNEEDRIPAKYKGAVRTYDETNEVKVTYISKYFYWMSPKALARAEKNICGSYKPFLAGADDVGGPPLYVGRTKQKPHFPGKVLQGTDGKPGRMYYGVGTKEHCIKDPPHDKHYEPTYQILVLGPKRSNYRCSIL